MSTHDDYLAYFAFLRARRGVNGMPSIQLAKWPMPSSEQPSWR